MKAMILAAGWGSRLGELTRHTPKCLIDVGGKPMLQHILERLKAAGVTSVVINLFHLGDQIRDFLARDSFGLEVAFSPEPELLGTGGGIKHAKALLKDAPFFIVHNSDVYSDLSLTELVAQHQQTRALATLAVMDRPSNRPLVFDSSGRLCGWENVERGTGEVFGSDPMPMQLAFSGIQVVSTDIFNYMEDEQGEFSSITVYLKAAQARQNILAYRMDSAYWLDMGTPSKLAELRQLLGPSGELV